MGRRCKREFCYSLPVTKHHVVCHKNCCLRLRSYGIVERRLQVLNTFEFTRKDLDAVR